MTLIQTQQSSTSWKVCTIQLEMLVMAQVLQSWGEQLMRRVMIVLGSPSLQRPRQGVQVDGLCFWRLSMMLGVSQIQTQTVLFVHWGEDPAEEDDRDSVVSGEQSVGSVEEEAMPFLLQGLRATQTAFRVLDDVNLTTAFEKRACLMHRVLERPFQTGVACWVGGDF